MSGLAVQVFIIACGAGIAAVGGLAFVYDTIREFRGNERVVPFYGTVVPWCVGGLILLFLQPGDGITGPEQAILSVIQIRGTLSMLYLLVTVAYPLVYLATRLLESDPDPVGSDPRTNLSRRQVLAGTVGPYATVLGLVGVQSGFFDPVAELFKPRDSDDDGVPDTRDDYPNDPSFSHHHESNTVTVDVAAQYDISIQSHGQSQLQLSIQVTDGPAVDVAVAEEDDEPLDDWFLADEMAESVRDWSGDRGLYGGPYTIWLRSRGPEPSTVRVEYTIRT